jgi:hypothetical protein
MAGSGEFGIRVIGFGAKLGYWTAVSICGPIPDRSVDRLRRESLVQLLTSSGFVDAVALLPGQSAIENPGALDSSERCEISVYVEARNPS